MLVAEDSAVCRRMVTRCLQGMHAAVVTAANGREVMALLAESHFDAVLLDSHMPVMDGAATMAAIKTAGFNVPVIVLSGSGLDGGEHGVLDFEAQTSHTLREAAEVVAEGFPGMTAINLDMGPWDHGVWYPGGRAVDRSVLAGEREQHLSNKLVYRDCRQAPGGSGHTRDASRHPQAGRSDER